MIRVGCTFNEKIFLTNALSFGVQLFVTRELSVDMDLEVYNRMLVEVQHNPKFVDYFPSIPA